MAKINVTRLLNYTAIILLFGLSTANSFPVGTTCSSYDLSQVIFPSNFNWNVLYLSSKYGLSEVNSIYSSSPFFSLISFLSNLFHLSASQQTFLYYFLFLSAVYWCFYLALKLFDYSKKLSTLQKTTFSLMYTFSFYSVYAFYYQCHFTPFLYLFPLVPLIFALLYRFVKSISSSEPDAPHTTNKYLAATIIVLAFTNIINFNIPYFFSLNIFIVGFFLAYYVLIKMKNRSKTHSAGITHQTFTTKHYLKNLFKFYILYALIIMWSVLPQAIEMLSKYNSFQTGAEIFDLRTWITWQAMKFPEPFLMFWNAGNYTQSIPLTVYLTLTFTFLAISFLILYKKRYKIELVLFSLYLLFIFLANKGVGWLPEFITWALFKNPLLASLRSYDKTLIFLPGILFIIIIVFYIRNKKARPVLNRLILILMAIVSIVSSYPLWSGQMQTKYSMINEPGKTYETSTYTGIHIIPDDYTKVADLINQDLTDYRILRVPYAVVESPGWVNFPKWKMLGADPTIQLFDAPTIQMNAYGGAFGTWNFGAEWNSNSEKQSEWLLNFVSITNTKYIIFHKDVQPQFIAQTQDKIDYYEKQGWITKIFEGEYINAYKIADQFFVKHFYLPVGVPDTGIIKVEGDQTMLPEVLTNPKYEYNIAKAVLFTENNADNPSAMSAYSDFGTRNHDEGVTWTEINPTKYTLALYRVNNKVPLVFSESYHTGWNLYLGQEYTWFTPDVADGSHVKINGYANAWVIDVAGICGAGDTDQAKQAKCVKNPDGSWDMEMTLEFTPQRTYDVSLVVTLLTLAGVVGYLVVPVAARLVRRNINVVK